jgi:hypothetical protein
MKKKRGIAWRGVIRRCRKGEKLCKQHSGKRVIFHVHPSDVRVAASVETLRKALLRDGRGAPGGPLGVVLDMVGDGHEA